MTLTDFGVCLHRTVGLHLGWRRQVLSVYSPTLARSTDSLSTQQACYKSIIVYGTAMTRCSHVKDRLPASVLPLFDPLASLPSLFPLHTLVFPPTLARNADGGTLSEQLQVLQVSIDESRVVESESPLRQVTSSPRRPVRPASAAQTLLHLKRFESK